MYGNMFGGINPYAPQMLSQQGNFIPQGMMQAPSQPMQYQQENRISVARVPTIDHVEQVQMAPGEMKIVLIQNNPDVLAIRVADTAGFVSTEYRTSQVFDPKAGSQMQFASYQDVAKLKREVEEIKNAIGGLNDAKPTVKSVIGAE